MKWGEGTVFVLGAGFTKAFIPKAPLLVDDYHVNQLINKYGSFKEARELLEMEVQLTQSEGYPAGWINLERLMTRIVSGMPYDYRAGADKSFLPLLIDLKWAFSQKLSIARVSVPHIPGELLLFAKHCMQFRISCITFNYDDLLDEALWKATSFKDPSVGWSPDWGYGFPCQWSESLIHGAGGIPTTTPNTLLLKLHGSINWRIPFGFQRPYGPHVIKHHNEWFDPGRPLPKANFRDVERLLDPEPLIVPPVLSKSELTEHPVMKVTWSEAFDKLRAADRVVFMGYSLPITDIAASFLFREGLSILDQKNISVVDFASQANRPQKLAQLLMSYRKTFPAINRGQFEFCGADAWIRDNLTTWLYDSKGQPVAFLANEHVISKTGRYVGSMRGYLKRLDFWHGPYKGDIVADNRFLRDLSIQNEDRGGSPLYHPPAVPTLPTNIEPMTLPQGFSDIDWTDEATIYAGPNI